MYTFLLGYLNNKIFLGDLGAAPAAPSKSPMSIFIPTFVLDSETRISFLQQSV